MTRILPLLIALVLVGPAWAGDALIELAPKYRQKNVGGMDCVHCSIVNCLRIVGLWDKADEYWKRYSGDPNGAGPGEAAANLRSVGVKYQITHDCDEAALEQAVADGRGAAVTWGGPHVINLVGIVNGNAVLMGNMNTRENHEEPWGTFLQKHRQGGGWAVIICSGKPCEPTRQ
jgi:hypothetical protein